MATSLTGQTLLVPDQANAETSANEFILATEQLGALNIIGFQDLYTPPTSGLTDGDAYIIGTGNGGVPIGDWTGFDPKDIAFYWQGWIRIKKSPGIVGNITDITNPELRGLVSYDAVQDEWFRVEAPLWFGDETFTGRYMFGGTTYPIHSKMFTFTLGASSVTQAHGVTLNTLGASGGVGGYAYVPYAFVRDNSVTAASHIITYTIPDKNTSIKVDEYDITIESTYGTGYQAVVYFEYVKAP